MASLRFNTPCDIDGICPYAAEYNHDCEYWCGARMLNNDDDYLKVVFSSLYGKCVTDGEE